MGTIEHSTHPLGKFVRSEKPFRLYDLALGVNPSGLDIVKLRALFRKKAANDPHSAAALFGAAVVRTEPPPYLLEGDIGGHLQSPKARGAPELPRGAVEHLSQGFGASSVEGGMHALGSRGTERESRKTVLVEGTYGVANRLRGAPQT